MRAVQFKCRGRAGFSRPRGHKGAEPLYFSRRKKRGKGRSLAECQASANERRTGAKSRALGS